MTDLVKSDLGLVEKNGVKMMSSKALAEMFEKRHDHVQEKIRNTLESLGSLKIGEPVNSRYYIERGENNSKTYWMDEGLSSLIAGKYSDDYALKVHDFFVEKKRRPPTNFKESLILLLEAEEEMERQNLLIEKQSEMIFKLQTEKSDGELLAEAYLKQDTSKTLTTFSKEIFPQTNLGRNQIFEILRKRGHLLENNLPSATMVKTGKFVIKEIDCNDGKTRPQAYVTPRGEAWLLKGLLGYVREEAIARERILR